MLEALPHRLVQQVARADALEHDGERAVAERHGVAGQGDVPIQPAGRGAPGIPAGVLVTAVLCWIAERAEPKIMSPDLWTLLER